MKHPTVVLFDLDNTLFDRRRALRCACGDWLESRFPNVDTQSRSTFVEDFLECDAWGYTPRENVALWMRSRLPSAPGDSTGRWIHELRRRCLEHVRPEPPVIEMLSRLAERCELGVVSNGAGRVQRTKLAKAGLDGLFKTIVISGEHGRRKPDPEIFRAALEERGSSPAQAMFVGDDPWRDIHGATRLGMQTCWISHGRSYPPTAPRPDRVVKHVRHFA